MASEKPGTLEEAALNGNSTHATEARIPSTERAGQSNAPEGAVRTHILVITLNEKPGAVDRVVGLLRRRRAHLQTLTIGRTEQPDVARITVVTDDSEVAVEQLIEQLRKVVDVQSVHNLLPQSIVERELALIKIKREPQRSNEIIELGRQSGAYIVDITEETVTLEITGTGEKIEKFIQLLKPFGIQEMARTGSVALPRGAE